MKYNLQGLKSTKRDTYGRLILGDIITSVNGKKVSSGSDLYRVLDQCKVGETVKLHHYCLVSSSSSFCSYDSVGEQSWKNLFSPEFFIFFKMNISKWIFASLLFRHPFQMNFSTDPLSHLLEQLKSLFIESQAIMDVIE